MMLKKIKGKRHIKLYFIRVKLRCSCITDINYEDFILVKSGSNIPSSPYISSITSVYYMYLFVRLLNFKFMWIIKGILFVIWKKSVHRIGNFFSSFTFSRFRSLIVVQWLCGITYLFLKYLRTMLCHFAFFESPEFGYQWFKNIYQENSLTVYSYKQDLSPHVLPWIIFRNTYLKA